MNRETTHTPPIRLWLLFIILLLHGCSSKGTPTGVHFPVTSGSHRLLPAAEQSILLWGAPDVTHVAVEWLRSHHYTHVVVADENRVREAKDAPPGSDRKAALTLGENMHAEFVLLLDRETNKEGTLIEPHCGARFFVEVTLRGLSVNNGETVLQARAHYPQCVELSGRIARSLTCQTFATAWGFRPSGQLDLPSHLMCTAGQTAPMANRPAGEIPNERRALPGDTP
ncbi:protein of unknown function [Nitrospira japonica]|uniref:Uncharacterized protein n=1 Tax=Nitrospira japonica TaxID=1325564 RepID=A0A1W1I9Z2_9BACT|nr:hypothetical protein [Nitrospira japonica]SLM49868.1 protein of unknown function [Nitrospira japonica]